jgi:plastocyanin
MDVTEVEFDDVDEGDVVVLEDDTCLVTSVGSASSGGKHGSKKVTLELVSLPGGSERRLNQPADDAIDRATLEPQRNPIVMVSDHDSHFDPLTVRVAAGGNVVWLWNDDAPHRLAAVDDGFESDLDSGEGFTFEHAFESPGTHLYRCTEHDQYGLVLVDDA